MLPQHVFDLHAVIEIRIRRTNESPSIIEIVVVEAIRALCARYPRKHTVMMPFLANMLRSDGGFEYKKAIVDTLISIVEENPDAKVAGRRALQAFFYRLRILRYGNGK